jgi:hypothetical protein
MRMLFQLIEKNAFRISLLIIFLTFFAGVGYAFYLGQSIRYIDEMEYLAIAQNIVDKGIFSMNGKLPTAWRPPGYPFLLTPVIYFGGGLLALRILNFVGLCASMALIYLFLKRVSWLASVIGILWVLCYPILFYTAGTLYPQTIATTLLLLSMTFLFYQENELSSKAAFIIGLLQGFLILMIPPLSIVLLLTVLWILLRYNRPMKSVLMMVLAAIIILFPWEIRNYRLFGEFVWISTNSGFNLLIGNSQTTQPDSGVNVDLSQYQPDHKMNEADLDNYYKLRAEEYIAQHKLSSLKMYLEKFASYFACENRLATKSEETRLREYVLMVSCGFLMGFFILRLILYRKISFLNYELFFILLFVLNGFFLALFFTRIRFRLPFDVLLIVINAGFLARWLKPNNQAD